MKTSVLYSNSFNPWFNLAVEDWIFNDMDPAGIILYLWRNSDTVVIGRYQNPWVECRLDRMKEDGVKLARRQSGGGAVYHDLNNLNFTIMSGSSTYDKNQNFEIIINALNALGVGAEVSGRNDLVVNGRKISGSAFKVKKDRCFHHGTLLVDTDLGRLSNYLNPDVLKLKSKGIKSVKSRVANLKDINPEITIENLSMAIRDAFFMQFGKGAESEIDLDSFRANSRVMEYYDLLGSDQWLYEKSPDFSHRLVSRFEWGGLEINIDVKAGRIERMKIFTDALCIEMIEALERAFSGSPHRVSDVRIEIERLKSQNPTWADNLEDIANIIINEIKA